MKRFLFLFLLLIVMSHVAAQSDDIPNNCPYANGAYYQQNLIPRYNAINPQIELVDWSSGAVQQSYLLTTAPLAYEIQGWSPECQYLSIAFSKLDDRGVERWDSIVWDVVNQTQVTSFLDARLSPYPLTWDTNSTQLLVETRFGAYLWKMDGSQVWLTSDADFNARSFHHGSVIWDYANNQVSGNLTISPMNGHAVYNMSDGSLVSLENAIGVAIDIERNNFRDTVANNGDLYPCQPAYRSYYRDNAHVYYEPNSGSLLLRDSGTHEVIQVIDNDLGSILTDTRQRLTIWSQDCRYLMVSFGRSSDDTVFYDTELGQRVLFIEGYRIRQYSFSPTGSYFVATTRNGANLYNLASGDVMPLNPSVRINTLGSGYVWTYDTIEWDMGSHQVRLGTTLSRSIYATRIYQTQVYDLATGMLVTAVDRDGEALDIQAQLEIETQRVAPYGCRWRVQYQSYNQQVVLHDVVTRDLMTVVQDNLVTDEFRYLGRSADCRYIAGAIWNGSSYDTYIWDLAMDSLVDVFADAHYVPHQISWSPYGGYALIHTRNGAYLWHLPSNSRVQLNASGETINTSTYQEAYVLNFKEITWDMVANQLLAVPVDQNEAVVAYDLTSGNQVGSYDLGGRGVPVDYFLLDSQHLIVYADAGSQNLSPEQIGFAIWNRQTGTSTQFAMEFYARPYDGDIYSVTYPSFSPDNRLMMMRSFNYVYIWDLTALVGDAPHLPNYTHQVESTLQIDFVDNSTIRSCEITTSREQLARRIEELSYYTYDAISGALLDTTIETRRYSYWYNDCYWD